MESLQLDDDDGNKTKAKQPGIIANGREIEVCTHQVFTVYMYLATLVNIEDGSFPPPVSPSSMPRVWTTRTEGHCLDRRAGTLVPGSARHSSAIGASLRGTEMQTGVETKFDAALFGR